MGVRSLLFALGGTFVLSRAPVCSITDFGAISGNRTADATKNRAALQAALASCARVVVPAGAFKIAPVALPSHSTLDLHAGASLVGSDDWRDYLPVVHFLPPLGNSGTQPGQLQLSPLLSARDAVNVTITGANGTIDANGWFAWPSLNWSDPGCGLHGRCAGPVLFEGAFPPHAVTFTHCAGCNVLNVTLTNPAFWGLQHFFCNDTVMANVTITAPRWTRQIAGFMPFSVRGYSVEDSYVHVGDDAVAIMSGPDFADPAGCPATAPCPAANWSWPTAGAAFRRLFVRGRSVAIGSEDFGNVTDVLFDNCTIGDDEGSAPWAFKIKMHSNVGARVGDIVVQNTRLGRISNNSWQDPGSSGGTAIFMAMAYSDPPVDPSAPQPRISNVSFLNVSATACVRAGAMAGGAHPIEGLHFRNCAFHATDGTPWSLQKVDAASCTSFNTTPPLPFPP